MKRHLVKAALALVFFAPSASAQYAPPPYAPAPGYSYAGPHPNHPSFGGGFCYTATQHVHPYDVDPNVAYLYRNYAGSYVFVGNVYEFGYARQAYPYYNHHPLAPEQGGTYCYIDGAHYHYFVPPASYAANHITYNGYYYYNGAYLPSYYAWRNSYYRSYHTYRYLPTYSRYYTSYRTYASTYGRPASYGYMRNPGAYSRPNPGGANVRVYNTSPAYRYQATGRPASYGYGAARPPATGYTAPSYRPTTSRPAQPARVWRR